MSNIDRRTAALLAIFGPLLATRAAPAAPLSSRANAGESKVPPGWAGHDVIAQLIYPNMTALDLVGPHYMLSLLVGAKVHLVAKTSDPVTSDLGLTVMPTTTFEHCPQDLTVLFAPGGTGALAAAADPRPARSSQTGVQWRNM